MTFHNLNAPTALWCEVSQYSKPLWRHSAGHKAPRNLIFRIWSKLYIPIKVVELLSGMLWCLILGATIIADRKNREFLAIFGVENRNCLKSADNQKSSQWSQMDLTTSNLPNFEIPAFIIRSSVTSWIYRFLTFDLATWNTGFIIFFFKSHL